MKSITRIYLFCCYAAVLPAQQVWYVNHEALGGNTGVMWTSAFTNLQSALAVANYGDQVWVAKGTYFPTDGIDREISFNLPNGVRLYGGFEGNEVLLEQRNPVNNFSKLSGDIGLTGMQTDNSYHVVTIYQGDENTVLDGFTITQGYAANAFSGYPHEFGGGVLVSSDGTWPLATPILAHCIFERNRAGSGGGLACIGNDWTICSPDIRHCTFLRNKGGYYGGAIYKIGRNRSDRAFTIYDCVFEANRSAVFGGGIAIYDPSDTVRITKCTFIRDTAIQAGAVRLWSNMENVHYEVDSCIFRANYTENSAPGLEHLFPGFVPVQKIELVVKRSIFFLNHNLVGIGGGLTSNALSDLAMHHVQVEECLFESNYSQNGGAGIFIEGGSGVNTEATVDRCWFLGNQTGASSVAGAFYYRGFGNALIRNQNTITNSVFMFNDGAIAALGGNPGISNTRVANCSFYKNGDIPFVKYWGQDNNPVDLVMKMQILNSVIWEPQTAGVHRLFYNNDPVNHTVNDYLIEHSLIHLPDCNYNGVDPCGEGMIYDVWPDFIDPEFGNTLDLWRCSPAQNRGSNLVVDTFGLDTDYWGFPRIVGDTVDMGAYEIQTLCISGTENLPYTMLPVGIRLLQNPINKSDPIEVELFAAVRENLQLQLVDANGIAVWKGSTIIPASSPSVFAIATHNFSPGLYYLQVMDAHGRSKTEKVVIFQ